MDKKGMAVGAFVLMAVMVIVAVALLPAIFSSQSQLTNTFKVNNYTITLGNNGTWTDTPWQELDGTFTFYNATGDRILVSNANFSVREDVSSSRNVKRVQISPCGASTCGWNSSTVNVSGTVGLEGYADDAGARGVGGLVGLLAVLALFAGVVYYFWKEGGLDFLNG